MAILKIHSDIVDEETRVVRLMWTGIDGTSFSTVDAFIDSIPENDNEIEIRLNCEGGNISEGWSIYVNFVLLGRKFRQLLRGNVRRWLLYYCLLHQKKNDLDILIQNYVFINPLSLQTKAAR